MKYSDVVNVISYKQGPSPSIQIRDYGTSENYSDVE